MIKLQNLTKIFNQDTDVEVTGVRDINLSFEKGHWYNIVGPNGSGKSTLLRLLAGEIMPSSGSIVYNGMDISFWPQEKRARIFNFIEQDTKANLVPTMTIEENLLLCFSNHRIPQFRLAKKKDKIDKIRASLGSFEMGIENRLRSQIRFLSGGEKQALVIAKTILEEADILLLDEYVAALDPRTAPHLLNITRKLASERMITVLMVSHDIDQVVECAGRLIFLNEGRLFAELDENKITKEYIIELFAIALKKRSRVRGD
jgi:putative ABC transport system ATP-binding protein